MNQLKSSLEIKAFGSSLFSKQNRTKIKAGYFQKNTTKPAFITIGFTSSSKTSKKLALIDQEKDLLGKKAFGSLLCKTISINLKFGDASDTLFNEWNTEVNWILSSLSISKENIIIEDKDKDNVIIIAQELQSFWYNFGSSAFKTTPTATVHDNTNAKEKFDLGLYQ